MVLRPSRRRKLRHNVLAPESNKIFAKVLKRILGTPRCFFEGDLFQGAFELMASIKISLASFTIFLQHTIPPFIRLVAHGKLG
jgi:hypothetical protein